MPVGRFLFILFRGSLLFVWALLAFDIPNVESIMPWSFVIGNEPYYRVGIELAFALEDNRAFCRYICPATVFLKLGELFSWLRDKNDEDKCVSRETCRPYERTYRTTPASGCMQRNVLAMHRSMHTKGVVPKQ